MRKKEKMRFEKDFKFQTTQGIFFVAPMRWTDRINVRMWLLWPHLLVYLEKMYDYDSIEAHFVALENNKSNQILQE
jgi:hypothetical protein